MRHSLALAAAVLPFAIAFFFTNLWIYQPLQDDLRSLSQDIEHRFEGVGRLQLSLSRSAMPINDYLIHGREQERNEFNLLASQVEASFAVVNAQTPASHQREREQLNTLKNRWHVLKQRGEDILQFDKKTRISLRAANAMEEFDTEIDRIIQTSDDLLTHIREDLQKTRLAADSRHEQLNWLVNIFAGLATLITLSMVIYLGQTIYRPFDQRASDHMTNTPEETLLPHKQTNKATKSARI